MKMTKKKKKNLNMWIYEHRSTVIAVVALLLAAKGVASFFSALWLKWLSAILFIIIYMALGVWLYETEKGKGKARKKTTR